MFFLHRANRFLQKIAALFLIPVMLFCLSACGSTASDPHAGLYEAVSAEMRNITVNIADVFENGFSLELKDGGKAVFHYDGRDYSMRWSLEGESFHAAGGGAELNGSLSNGKLQLTDVLDSDMDILLICDELVLQTPDSPADSAAPEEKSIPPVSGEAQQEAVPPEPVLEVLATLPSYDAAQSMAMSNWEHYGYCLIEDGMLYGRYFVQKAQYASLVALELRREGAALKGGKWLDLDDSCWPNYVQKRGNTLYYLKCRHGGGDIFALARVDIDGSDPQVLYEGECSYLSVTDDRLFFTDASNRLLSISPEGGEPQIVLDKAVYYSYALDNDWILYQDDADSESLHLYHLPEGLDFPLNSERSYEPVLCGSLLFYTTIIDDTHYLRCIDLTSYEERYDEKLGCHVPVFNVEQSELPFDDGFLLDGTSIIDFLTAESRPMEDWKDLQSSSSAASKRNLRFVSADLFVMDVHGNSGGIKSIQFIDRSTGTVSTIHWLH